MPSQLPQKLLASPSIYIVRDGRDAIASAAFHRKDFVDKNSHVLQNMSEAIIASNNSHFGGWSQNVYQWVRHADFVIRFEDLIEYPEGIVDAIAKRFQIRGTNSNANPSFELQRKGEVMYGASCDKFGVGSEVEGLLKKKFRKGQMNGWKEEMPSGLQSLFWDIHGRMMEKMGYGKDGSRVGEDEFQNYISTIKLTNQERSKSILIEATKADEGHNDGVKRYVHTLLKALREAQNIGWSEYEIKVKVFDAILTLNEAIDIELKKVLKLKGKRQKQEGSYANDEVEEAFSKNWFSHLVSQLKRIKRRLPKKMSLMISLAIRFSKVKVYYGRYRLANIEKKFSKLTAIKFDLIHYTLPQILDNWKKGKRHLVTIHDITHLNHPQFHLQNNIDQAELGFRIIRERTPYLLSVSESTCKDLRDLEGFKHLKKRVIYEAVDHHHFHILYDKNRITRILEKFRLRDSRFLLCLATNEPRKNIKNTILGFLKLIDNRAYDDVKLVIGGKPGWKEEELEEHPNIIYTGYVLDEDLCALYNAAIGFCYISYYEGFGLPPLEAMRCGTVPIYGNNSAMKELIQGAGLSTAPGDVDEISHNMEILVSNPTLRKKMEAMAYDRSLEFSISKMAKNTLEYYNQILA